jgi:hypothetical protein
MKPDDETTTQSGWITPILPPRKLMKFNPARGCYFCPYKDENHSKFIPWCGVN